MRFSDQDALHERPDRPLGVAVLCLWDGLIYGIAPIILSVFGILRGSAEDASIGATLLTVFLSVIIVTTSIGAFAGNDRSRLALVYAVVIYLGLNVFDDVIFLASRSLEIEPAIRSIFQIILAFLGVGVHVWYFFRPSTMDYYRRPKARAIEEMKRKF